MSANLRALKATDVTFDESRIGSPPAMPLAAIVGFYFSFRLFFVLLAVRVFNQDAQAGAAASLAVNYLLLILAGFHAFGSARRTRGGILNLPCFRWVLVFLAFSGLSLFWSVTASLPAAAAFWCAMAADTAIVVLLLRGGLVDAAVNSLMRGYIWGTCFIAVVAWLLPSQSDLRLGDEELLGPNQIGWACAFAFFFAQYLMRKKDGNWTMQALLLAITLLRSLSKTTIIAFVAGEAYIVLRDRSITRRSKLLLTASSLLIVAVFSGLLANYYDVYTNAGNQSETLTGRLGIWGFILNEAIDKAVVRPRLSFRLEGHSALRRFRSPPRAQRTPAAVLRLWRSGRVPDDGNLRERLPAASPALRCLAEDLLSRHAVVRPGARTGPTPRFSTSRCRCGSSP